MKLMPNGSVACVNQVLKWEYLVLKKGRGAKNSFEFQSVSLVASLRLPCFSQLPNYLLFPHWLLDLKFGKISALIIMLQNLLVFDFPLSQIISSPLAHS